MRTKLAILLLALPVLTVTLSARTSVRTGYDNSLTISGLVSDEGGNPIANVQVRAYREDREQIGENRTKSDGSYSISFAAGTPISTLRYDLTGWNVAAITEISGAKSHTINKVLFGEGTARTEYRKTDLAQTLARVYAIDKARGVSDSEFVTRYWTIVKKEKLSMGETGSVFMNQMRGPGSN